MKLEIHVPPWATQVLSDLTDMDRNPHPVDAAKVKRFRLDLPDDVYFEYAFRDAEGRLRPDPEVDLRAASPWFPQASAVFGPEYTPDPFADLPAELEAGTLTRHRLVSAALDQQRRVTVYTPAGGHGPLPLTIVQDGTAYLRLGGLPRVLEALLARGEVRPAHLAFVEPIVRSAEYAFEPRYRTFVADELLPALAERHDLTGERILWGASLGGLFSLTLALEQPGFARTVVTQSAALLGAPGDLDHFRSRSSWVLDRVAERAPDLRIYQDVGTIEWLTDSNRRLRELLASAGVEHAYRERNAGHNWVNWRNGLAAGLRFALAPS
jgi:enterochelin esterase family protein